MVEKQLSDDVWNLNFKKILTFKDLFCGPGSNDFWVTYKLLLDKRENVLSSETNKMFL